MIFQWPLSFASGFFLRLREGTTIFVFSDERFSGRDITGCVGSVWTLFRGITEDTLKNRIPADFSGWADRLFEPRPCKVEGCFSTTFSRASTLSDKVICAALRRLEKINTRVELIFMRLSCSVSHYLLLPLSPETHMESLRRGSPEDPSPSSKSSRIIEDLCLLVIYSDAQQNRTARCLAAGVGAQELLGLNGLLQNQFALYLHHLWPWQNGHRAHQTTAIS